MLQPLSNAITGFTAGVRPEGFIIMAGTHACACQVRRWASLSSVCLDDSMARASEAQIVPALHDPVCMHECVHTSSISSSSSSNLFKAATLCVCHA